MADQTSPPKPGGIFRNWLSAAGFVIALGASFAFVLLFATDLLAHRANPYLGILTYVIAPGFLILGMVLMVAGVLIHRRHLRKKGPEGLPHVLTIDFSRPRERKVLIGFVSLSVLFLFLTAFGSYQTYHYTESVQFCGQACHVPMNPEFTAYLNSPHARIDCVECHVGEGATAYLKSKINGVHQLYCSLTGEYQRPIKTPIRNLRPAQETCEQCHWPSRFVGNLDRTYPHFLADETNTEFTVRMSVKVGGGDSNHGPEGGIHWHMNVANQVEYLANDDKRQQIPWVRFTDSKGVPTEFRAPDFKDEVDPKQVRKMDCLDCHNRPAHQFLSPNHAVDLAIAAGRIDRNMPWVKSNVVAALIQPYAFEEESRRKITESLRASYPDHPKVQSLIDETLKIYGRNFFPEMKADWRAYPDNLSHKDWAGCFRCHDGLHKTVDGKKTLGASDCNSCHTILAQGSGADLAKLNPAGHAFFHIDAEYQDFSCNKCHTGAFPK